MAKTILRVVVAIGLAAGSVSAQSGTPNGNWRAPRTPDGHPDLQGVWSNNGVTPMVRPKQWENKERLTDQELAELKTLVSTSVDQSGDAIFDDFIQIALDLKDSGRYDQRSYDPTTGNYNQFWMADRDWDNRTSLIIDPPNGQFPPLTPAGQARLATFLANASAARGLGGRADGPEDRPLSERCVSYGAPATHTGYNSYTQIVQSPEAVVLLQEMIHDARVVPMGRKEHLPQSVRQWHGDPVGWWDGDTLVVETTNYLNGLQNYSISGGTTPNVRLTERYTRVSPDYINWELTVDDPATWTQPWTFMIRLKRTDDQIYEYACHEGNYALQGMLAGARLQEAKATAGAADPTTKSR